MLPTTCRNSAIASRVERSADADGQRLLNLQTCDVSDEDLNDLASDDRLAARLRILNLSENPVGRWLGGLSALERCLVLKGLKLHCCRLGDIPDRMEEFATGLEACGSLRALGLGHNGLTAAMVRIALARAQHVTVLHLPGNKFEDAAELVDALAPLAELAYLNLSCNSLSDTAALADGLAHMKGLTCLRLCGCTNLQDIMPFTQLLPENGGNLQTLDVRECGDWIESLGRNHAASGYGTRSTAMRLYELAAESNRAGPWR